MLTLLVLASTLLVQSSGLSDFAGIWMAELKGQPLARLELTLTNGQLQGQLGLSGLHTDANGDPDATIPEAGYTLPVFDVLLRDGILSFAVKDGDDTDRFELRLTEGRAMLTLFVDSAFRAELAREGIAPPRPIALTRR